MPDLLDHIAQANHNEQCANFLLGTQQATYRDWAITAAFYAAVHFAEACFTTCEIGHTESAADRGDEEKHAYRQRKVKERANPAWKSYRKLREASDDLRYLTRGNWQDYYSAEVAQRLIQEHLPRVRGELERAFHVNLH